MVRSGGRTNVLEMPMRYALMGCAILILGGFALIFLLFYEILKTGVK